MIFERKVELIGAFSAIYSMIRREGSSNYLNISYNILSRGLPHHSDYSLESRQY